jgi:hypothetical protein
LRARAFSPNNSRRQPLHGGGGLDRDVADDVVLEHAPAVRHRSAYAAMLCEALEPWLLKPVSATLAAKSGDIAVLKVSLGNEQNASAYSEAAGTEFDQFLKSVTQSLSDALPGNVQLVPDLRFVIGGDMYLVKPIQLRHWLRSAALADAEQIAAELSAAFARDSKGDVRRARG